MFRDQDARATGELELSINWQDDEGAIPLALAQKKTDNTTLQFKGGLALVPREHLDRLFRLPAFGKALSYDRQPIPGNPYHGNLLMSNPAAISKMVRSHIAATIAMHVSMIIDQPDQ
jgi:hypothetical protein